MFFWGINELTCINYWEQYLAHISNLSINTITDLIGQCELFDLLWVRFPPCSFCAGLYSIWAHQRALYEFPLVLLAAFSFFFFLNQDDSWLFYLNFLEMLIPLMSGAPFLFCVMGHKIIILCSELLEICFFGVWGTLIWIF